MSSAQNPQAAQLLSQLADIDGLDAVSAWPLAPGWWALIASGVCLLICALLLLRRRRRYRRSWQYEALNRLKTMASQLNEETLRDSAGEFSALLRRIAVHRFSREACAGLEGTAWTDWLSRHDPKGFDWNAHVGLLTQLPYAPSAAAFDSREFKALLHASMRWVK